MNDIGTIMDESARQAVAEAIERHRRLGESIVVWHDGQIVWLSPDEIPPLQTAQEASDDSTT